MTLPVLPGGGRVWDSQLDLLRWSAAEQLDVQAAVARVTASGRYILDQEVTAFEQEFGDWLGAPACVGVGNGTDALTLILMALGLPVGAEVMVAANAGFFGSIAAVRAGLRPVAVDVDRDTLQLDPADLESRLTADCGAVIWTHLYGLVTDLAGLATACRLRGIVLIEDCAQAAGAIVNGRTAGSWGTAGAWSFYPTKNLGALGDGGAVTTSDPALAERVRALRAYGEHDADRLVTVGLNSRLDELQAAVLRARLKYVLAGNTRRRLICHSYRSAFGSAVGRVFGTDREDFSGHLAVVDCGRRNEVAAELAVRGIPTRVRYPVPSHLAPAFRGFSPGPRPEAERACERVLCLPCSPGMTDEEVNHVRQSIATIA